MSRSVRSSDRVERARLRGDSQSSGPDARQSNGRTTQPLSDRHQHRRTARAPAGHGRPRSAAPRGGNSLSSPCSASAPTAWASGRCPEQVARSARRWPPSAASLTADQRPDLMKTGPTTSLRCARSLQRRVRRDPRRNRRADRHPRALHAVLVDRVQEDPSSLLHARLRRMGSRARARSRAAGRRRQPPPHWARRARRRSTNAPASCCPAA